MAATLPCRKWVLSRDAGSAVIAVGPGALVKLAGDGECNAGEQRHGNEGACRHDPNLVLGLIVHRALHPAIFKRRSRAKVPYVADMRGEPAAALRPRVRGRPA